MLSTVLVMIVMKFSEIQFLETIFPRIRENKMELPNILIGYIYFVSLKMGRCSKHSPAHFAVSKFQYQLSMLNSRWWKRGSREPEGGNGDADCWRAKGWVKSTVGCQRTGYPQLCTTAVGLACAPGGVWGWTACMQHRGLDWGPHCIWCPAGLALYAGSSAWSWSSLQTGPVTIICPTGMDEFDIPGLNQQDAQDRYLKQDCPGKYRTYAHTIYWETLPMVALGL